MIARYRAGAELFLACAALAGSAGSWSRTRSTVAVAPVIDGQPVTLSVVYHPQPLVLTLLLATIAGVLSVVGTARLRRARAGERTSGRLEPASARRLVSLSRLRGSLPLLLDRALVCVGSGW